MEINEWEEREVVVGWWVWGELEGVGIVVFEGMGDEELGESGFGCGLVGGEEDGGERVGGGVDGWGGVGS